MENSKTVIGTATMVYDADGKPVTGHFDAAIHLNVTDDEVAQLVTTTGNTQEDIKRSAENLMAAWFLKVDSIELADRENYHIVSQVLQCDKYASGKPSKVVIQFSIEPLLNPQAN